MSPKLVGAVTGSNPQFVAITVSSTSLAVTVTPTGLLYQPFDPFGDTGSSVTTEVGAVESTGVHCAYKVTSAANEYVAPSAYAVPEPVAAVFQPVKSYPVRVKVFVVNAVGALWTSSAIDPDPPFASKCTTATLRSSPGQR